MSQEGSKLVFLIPIGILIGILALYLVPHEGDVLLVGCTTSLYDTGLLDLMVEEVSEKLNIRIKFVSTGTGLALRNAARGDVDALLVHAPSEESKFLEDGHGVNRKLIAYNFFVIVGPESDPASIKNLTPVDALTRIREVGLSGGAIWVSRGDGSGTNIKEIGLWKQAGFDLDQIREEPWYVEAGSGMSNTLRLASEREGYTLTDSASHRRLLGNGMTSTVVLVEAGRELLNVYSAIVVDPTDHPNSNFEEAMEFVSWLVSEEGQNFIGAYGAGNGEKGLFLPISDVLGSGGQIAFWIRDYAFIEGSECPPKYRFQEHDLYKKEA